MAKNCRANLDPITYSVSEFVQMCVHAHVRETKKKNMLLLFQRRALKSGVRFLWKRTNLTGLAEKNSAQSEAVPCYQLRLCLSLRKPQKLQSSSRSNCRMTPFTLNVTLSQLCLGPPHKKWKERFFCGVHKMYPCTSLKCDGKSVTFHI